MQKTIEKDADGKVRHPPPRPFFTVVVLGRQRGSYQEPEGMEMAKKGLRGERAGGLGVDLQQSAGVIQLEGNDRFYA